MAEGNVNKNEVALKKLPDYQGKKLLKVLNVVIGEKKSENKYWCVNEDGEKVLVPATHFDVEE